MASKYGTNPNQIPLNLHLGSMAYQRVQNFPIYGKQLLTPGTTVNLDCFQTRNFNLFPVQSFTLANPTSLLDGMRITIKIKQDATGSRVVTYGSKYKFPGGSTNGVLSTAANSIDFLSCEYDATDDLLYCVLTKAYA